MIEQTGASGNELIVIRYHNAQQTTERIGQMAQPDEAPARPKFKGSRKSWADSD